MFPAVLALGLLVVPDVAFDASSGAQPSLSAQAAASGRPKECAGATSGKRAQKITVWQRVRYPKLATYCAHVARAQALLETDAKGSLEAVDKAEKEWAGRAGASVARGRALLALDKADEALAAFEAAKKIDESSLEEPKAMRDYARALVLKNRVRDAAVVYRAVVPRADLLPPRVRARTLMEAAFASMTAEAAGEAPPNADTRLVEALAFLDEVRRGNGAPLVSEATLASALVHDRRGDASKAAGMAAEAARSGLDPAEATWVADPADRHALRALGLEGTDVAGATEAWTAYLGAAKDGPYAAAARTRLAALKKKPAPAAKKPKKAAR
jgi:tetratricopeptide (TPR) repeat protein